MAKVISFELFMRANKKTKENGKYAPTMSLTDEDGRPLEWEFRHIGAKESNELRSDCTREVAVPGKPGLFREKFDSDKYLAKLIAAATVYPDLYNAGLQESYGVNKPEELVLAMVDDIGEYNALGLWIQDFLGLSKSEKELIEEAKN